MRVCGTFQRAHSSRIKTEVMRGTPALVRLEKQLAEDPCRQAHGARGIRDRSIALASSQYRLRAVENGRLTEFRADLARRDFHFLGRDNWVAKWRRANQQLGTRMGVLDGGRTRPRHRG